MKHYAIHICSFQAGPAVTRKLSYRSFKQAVLTAGRFSVFEATIDQRTARFYDRLCKDPDVITELTGFPWTNVRRCP